MYSETCTKLTKLRDVEVLSTVTSFHNFSNLGLTLLFNYLYRMEMEVEEPDVMIQHEVRTKEKFDSKNV